MGMVWKNKKTQMLFWVEDGFEGTFTMRFFVWMLRRTSLGLVCDFLTKDSFTFSVGFLDIFEVLKSEQISQGPSSADSGEVIIGKTR